MDRPERLKHILHEAVLLAGAQRTAYLEAACGEDTDLHSELSELLQCLSRSGPFLESALLSPGGPGQAARLDRVTAGDVVGGYRIGQLIGKGAMGRVFEARDMASERPVAFKIMRGDRVARRFLAKFEAELRALTLMDHDNIARVVEYGVAPGDCPFIVMEFVHGSSITEYCDGRRMRLDQRCLMLAEVCDALHHAHERGVIHCDLKPANILIRHSDACVKLIDFGVARASTKLEQSAGDGHGDDVRLRIVGTPAYMSPEQRLGGPLDRRSDLYSIGAILLELVTGVTAGSITRWRTTDLLPPASQVYRERSSAAWRWRSANRRGVGPGELMTLLDGQLSDVIVRGMATNVAARYQSAVAFANDLRRCADSLQAFAAEGETT